ncbi:MAG TPA: hypothetical protein VKX49_05695 [Bryobacteraceae bacterium]|nr:hypothetical protein [Bryobacteraceae bacterium]
MLSMCINHVIENEKLTVAVWGSVDGIEWGDKPLVSFPPKSYCGVYSVFLNLAAHPHVRYLQLRWNMARYGHGSWQPLFGFHVSVQASAAAA